MRRAARLSAFAGALVGLVGCGESLDVYPMRGQLYDEVNDCLGSSAIIDVVDGPPPDPCDGYRCLRSVESGELFVSAHCGAPIGWTEEDPAVDAVCAAALAAKDLGADGLCE